MARQNGTNEGARLTRTRIIVYLVAAFGIAWVWAFAVVWPLYAQTGSFNTNAQLATAGCMFAPTLAVLVARLVTHEGFSNANIRPRSLKSTWKYYVLAWVGPLVLVVIGTGLWFLLNPGDFDSEMTTYIASSQAQLEAAGQAGEVDADQLRATLPLQLAVVLVAPVANLVPSLGEEWGWRGYLLPKLLERHSMGIVLLSSGVIWGLWHAPLIALGHNYGTDYPGFPVGGILAMCVLCIVLGVFMSYVTLRSGSCLPAAIAHGMFNGCYSMGILFSTTGGNPFLGPAATGIVGGIGFVVAAGIMGASLIRSTVPARLAS